MRKAQHGDNTNHEYYAADSVQIPQPISKTQPSWDPTNATPLFEENDFELSHSQPSDISNGRPVAPADNRDDDWVVVEPQAPGEPYRMVPSGVSKQPASGPTTTEGATSSEVTRSNATHAQQAPPETSPQRNSSFVGLPPIRRSSTFGINYARRAKERFSLDEDEMDNFSRTSTLDANAGPSTLSSQQQQYNSAVAQQSGDLPTGTGAQTRDSQQGLAGDTLGASSLGRPASYASSEVDVGDDPEKPPVAEPAPYQNRRTAPMQHQNMRSPPGVLGQNISGGNPVQHLPPQGPWKLEESHLSEPLLPASRSRHTSDTSQAYFGFDKEIGVTNPVPIQQRSAVQMPPRQKFSETPPSSARRYPELFSRAAGQQQPPPQQQLQQQQQPQQQQQQSQKHLDQTMSRTSLDLPPQVYQQQPPSREDMMLQRSNTSEFQVPGVGPPPEDHRGRERRGSGIFKEIGGRFRTASRERKGSVIEGNGFAQQPGVDVQGDEVSESSFDTQELRERKKKRRSSFFLSLRGSKPASSDGPPGASGDDTANSSDVAEQPQTHTQLQQQFADQRKRSFFGSTPGSGLGLPTLSRTSTSSNVHETEGSLHSHQSPKKRLSTLTGKFFHRSSGQVEEPPKPMTAQSTTPSLQSRLSGLPNTQPGVPSPLANHRRERSDTATSRPPTDHEPQYQNQGDAHDVKHADRGRRASAGNFLAGLLGNRTSSKPREAHPQPERLPQDQPQQFHFQRQPQAQAGQVGHQPSPQPVFQPGTGDAQHVNRQSPPPFRTQGPPVHPVAGVASPEQRGQSSFPSPQKAPDNTRVSVQQVNSDTDEAGSDTEQTEHADVATAATLQAKPSEDLPQSQVHTRPVPDVNSQPLGLPTVTGMSNEVSPNASPDFSSVNHQTHRDFGAGTERMPFSPDHVQHVQRIETQQTPRGQSGLDPETLGQLPARSIQKQSSGADLLPPREQFSSSPRLNNGYQPPPSETSLQDRRVSHLSMGSFQEPSTHSSPNLSSQVDPRVQRPVSISPVPQGLHQPPGTSIHARASAPLLTTQTTANNGFPHGYGPSQAPGQSFGPGLAFSNSQEPPESRRSRWLMGKSSQQPVQASQPKPEKEKSAKSIFNAFKRSSKLPSANQAQPDLAAYRTNSHQLHQQTMQGRPLNPEPGPQQSSQQSFSQRQHQEAQAHGQPQQLLRGPANHLAQGQAPPLSHPQPTNGHAQMGPHHLYQQQRISPATVPVPGHIDPRHNSFNSPHQPHGRSPELDQRGARSPPQPAQSGGYDTSATHEEHGRMGQGLGGPRFRQNISADQYPAPVHQLAHNQQQQRSLIEPQYDQVPIPRGYAAVHGEGSIEPSPYLYGRRVSGGFQQPSFEQQPSNNTVNRRQFSAEQLYRPYSHTQQVQPALQYGVSPPLGQQASLRDSIASGSSSQNMSRAGHPATHSGPPVGLGLDRQQAGYGGQNVQPPSLRIPQTLQDKELLPTALRSIRACPPWPGTRSNRRVMSRHPSMLPPRRPERLATRPTQIRRPQQAGTST
ncbi:predicted protein [Verticillium alfalfae VaMs.102]|uniref:Predicted protein n=1 Tax=Verticillium alfalfae (strain VaMs.102 / ATCC MYA-4576 / FGSC 10136) TaxID=526221 RepID=C9SBU3_VERA1|nr:predicted protein [Verticillium alfalfae VaMs.102]EEY15827.1 predicted protein [Verticillium alfalfae VaMs.102]